MDYLQAIVIGILQGIVEWLPLSSEGVVTLALVRLFDTPFSQALHLALWLHLGTLIASIIYFRKEIIDLCKHIPSLITKKPDTTLLYIVIASFASFVVGGILFFFVLDSFEFSAIAVSVLIAGLLLITGLLQIFIKKKTQPKTTPHIKDALLVGLGQGFAVLPGISRSGTTTSILLLQKYDGNTALKLSFILSIPVTAGAVVMMILTESVAFTPYSIVALLTAGITGLASIHVLLNVAKKINFGYFCLIFAGLVLVSILFI